MEGDFSMKNIINNNKISTSDIQISAMGIITEIVAVRDVKPMYKTDSEGKRTDIVEAIRYDCVNPNDYSTFTLKTLSIKPVITAEELEMSETPVFISIPVNDVVIKPYKIEYGIATVSIIAPYVKLVSNDKGIK